jgi:hypothetical protein
MCNFEDKTDGLMQNMELFIICHNIKIYILSYNIETVNVLYPERDKYLIRTVVMFCIQFLQKLYNTNCVFLIEVCTYWDELIKVDKYVIQRMEYFLMAGLL